MTIITKLFRSPLGAKKRRKFCRKTFVMLTVFSSNVAGTLDLVALIARP